MLKLSPKAENRILTGYAVACLLSFADLASDSPTIKGVGFTFRLTGLVAAIAVLVRTDTPAKVEADRESLTVQVREWEAAVMAKVESEKQRIMTETQRERDRILTEARRIADSRSLEIDTLRKVNLTLKAQLQQLNAPQLDNGSKTQNWNCNKIILHLWKRHEIICDCSEAAIFTGESEIYFLSPRNPSDIKKIKSDDMVAEFEAVLNSYREGAIAVDQLGSIVRVTYKLGEDSRVTKLKKLEDKRHRIESKLMTIEDTVKKNLGYLVIGEPGSGKTSAASYIAQSIITQEASEKAINDLNYPDAAMCIALDIHQNTIWGELGITCISDPIEIYQQFQLLKAEYDSRKPGSKTDRLIIFFDEMAETLDTIKAVLGGKDGKEAINFIQETYRQFGTGGRKKYINFIGLNHSWNTAALGLDGYYRKSFISILLNDAARYYCQRIYSRSDDIYQWFMEAQDNKYCALAVGAINDKLTKHPTHHDYDEIKDGNPPQNLKPIKLLPLNIKTVGNGGLVGGQSPPPPLPPDKVESVEALRHLTPPKSTPPPPLPHNGGILPLPPMPTTEAKELILQCINGGLNQQETILKVWGIKKNGKNENWQKAREIYNDVKQG